MNKHLLQGERTQSPDERQKKIRRRILIAAVAVLAVVIALIVVYFTLFRRPEPERSPCPRGRSCPSWAPSPR